MRSFVSTILAFILILSLPVMGVSGISSIDGETDLQNELEKEGSIYQFEQDGVASAEIGTVNVTIAKASDDVGYDHFIMDPVNNFLKVEHTADTQEEVIFYVPDDYFEPRPKSGLKPLEGGPAAELERVTIDGEYYTRVEIEFEGNQTVIYPIDQVMGSIFTVRGGVQDTFFNTTPAPEPSNDEIWREKSINRNEIGNGVTIVDTTVGDENRTDITVVYEPDRVLPWGEKLPVPECGSPSDIDNVCFEEQRGGEAQILFKNVDTTNPTIMYKHDIGFLESMALGVNDMAQIPDRIELPFFGGKDQ